MISKSEDRIRRILLVGNPNVGKSALFQRLCGEYVEISNYPGTTVELLQADFAGMTLIDTPGAYSVSSLNDEESITAQALAGLEPDDLVLNIVNLTSLERDLFLTFHLIELGIPFVLIINQIDAQTDFELNYKLLQGRLGIPLYQISALNGTGIEHLKEDIKGGLAGRLGHASLDLKTELQKIQTLHPRLKTNREALLWLEEDIALQEILSIKPPKGSRNHHFSQRRKRINHLLERISSPKIGQAEAIWQARLNDFLIQPFTGGCTFLLIGFFFLYQVLGVWVAGDLVNLLEKGFFEKYWNPVMQGAVAQVFPSEIHFPKAQRSFVFSEGLLRAKPPERRAYQDFQASHPDMQGEFYFSPSDRIENDWQHDDRSPSHSPLPADLGSSLGTILAGKYGLLTLTITYLFGVLMPLVWFFYLSWAVLEDSGYLPRLAVLADGFCRRLGLNGRGVIPLILGLGCVTMAVVTTRLMKSRREQLILMILLAIAVPCSAQLGIIQGLLARIGGLSGWLVWLGMILGVLYFTGVLASRLIPGTASPLILDLPPLRLPRLSGLLYKANHKSWFFLKESGLAFTYASASITLLQVIGALGLIIDWLKPLVANILHLPPEVALSFLLGMVRRDFGAFGLLDLSLSATQAVTACVALTLFVPCIATFGVMIKERNLPTALGIWFLAWILGFGVGGALTRVLEILHF